MFDGDGAPTSDQENVPSRSKGGIDLLEVAITNEAPPGLGTPERALRVTHSWLNGVIHLYSLGCDKVDHVASIW